MEKQYDADTVDENGVVHETVGENIRNGAKDPDSITNSFVKNDDKQEFNSNMRTDAFYLKNAILQALTGNVIPFAYSTTNSFSSEQKQQIKNWLGVTEVGKLTQQAIEEAITNIPNFNNHIGTNVLTFANAIYNLLSGHTPYFGGADGERFTSEQLEAIKTYLGIQSVDLGTIYPVGSVYIASNTTLDPSAFLPGTWEKIQPTEYASMPHFVALYTGSRPDPGVVTEFQYDNNIGTSSVYYMTLVFWKRTA